MNFKLTFTSNEDIMEKYGSTQGRSISTNKIVEFIKPLISIDLPNMAAQMRFCLESGEGFKIFPQKISVQQLNFSYKNVSFLKNDIYEISVLERRVVL